MNDDFKVIIPAFREESDFTNKAIIDIHGKTMIQYTYECAAESQAAEVIIATGSPSVGMAAEAFGATVCMVVDDDLTGINRLTYVVDKMGWGDDTVIVNLPGDSPLSSEISINQIADNLSAQTEVDAAVLYTMVAVDAPEQSGTIYLVTDNADNVIYFSRQPLPRQTSDQHILSQYKCCTELRAYRAGLLRIARNFTSSELDKVEQIEELKLLYNGMKVYAAPSAGLPGQQVHTEEDLKAIIAQMSPA